MLNRRATFIKIVSWMGILVGLVLVTSPAQANHQDAGYEWGYPYQVKWDSAVFPESSSIFHFPSDMRARFRWGAAQYDDYYIGSTYSALQIDEITMGENVVFDKADFSSWLWDDVPGQFFRYPTSGATITSGAIFFNSDYDFDFPVTPVDQSSNDLSDHKADAQTIAVHEMGHIIGFEHPCLTDPQVENNCDSTTVMGQIWTGTFRWLTTHDKDLVKAIY